MIHGKCPACNTPFRVRRNKRCPWCKAVLIHPGEGYYNDDGDRTYIWTGTTWAEYAEPQLHTDADL